MLYYQMYALAGQVGGSGGSQPRGLRILHTLLSTESGYHIPDHAPNPKHSSTAMFTLNGNLWVVPPPKGDTLLITS